jgi:amidase
MIRRGEVSSEELVRGSLQRIAACNPRLQAFVSVLEGQALRTARRMDRRVRDLGRDPASLPPFWGVPIGIKDLNLVRGAFARMGSAAFTWLWSPVDDVTVADLRRAGFVIVGKTATSELAILPVVEPDIHPPTRNPLDEERTAGGSSGGAAAAVAAGLLPVAHASDGGGSIRIPASFCGLVGHKPSRGLLPNPYRRVERFGLSTNGVITRTVEDSAALLDVLSRRVPAQGGVGPFLSAARRPCPPLRVRLSTTPPIGATAPEVEAAVRRLAARLAALGHEVREAPPMTGTLAEFLPIYQRMAADAPVLREGRLQPLTRWLRAEGRRLRHPDVAAAREALAARVLSWFGDADVVLTPAVPVPPPRVGAFAGLPPQEHFARAAVLGAFTALCNLSGQPAISVPAGRAGGLPVGAQLIGRPGEDATLLMLARQIERDGH